MSKKQGPKMVMKADDVAYRQRLLDRWDHACVICGYGFTNVACVTKEHIVPKSAPEEAKVLTDNIGPSHYQCNNTRGTRSLIKVAAYIEKKRTQMGSRLFFRWLNTKVPHRIVPEEALAPTRGQRFLDLPDHLPGMP